MGRIRSVLLRVFTLGGLVIAITALVIAQWPDSQAAGCAPPTSNLALGPWGTISALSRGGVTLVWGLPLAYLAVIYFAVLAIVDLGGARLTGSTKSNTRLYVFCLSILGLGLALTNLRLARSANAWPSGFGLILDVAAVATFLLAAPAEMAPLMSLPRSLLRDAWSAFRDWRVAAPIAVAAAGVVLGGLRLGTLSAQPLRTPSPAAFTHWIASQPRKSVPVPSDGARILVVKFNDFQCPPCRRTHEDLEPVLKRLQSQHPGAIKYVVKDFPLDSECNPVVEKPMHAAACDAAAAVRVAEKAAGKGDALAEWLFAHQTSLNHDLVWATASELAGRGFSQSEHADAVAKVRGDVAFGRNHGVRRTPTFLINGLELGGLPPDLFEAALNYELLRTASNH